MCVDEVFSDVLGGLCYEELDGASVFHERPQVADDLLGALPMHRISGPGVDLQGGIGDRPCKSFLFFTREKGAACLPCPLPTGITRPRGLRDGVG